MVWFIGAVYIGSGDGVGDVRGVAAGGVGASGGDADSRDAGASGAGSRARTTSSTST